MTIAVTKRISDTIGLETRAETTHSHVAQPAERALARPEPSRFHRLSRYAHTASHLMPTQACHWVLRRALGRRYRVPARPASAIRNGVNLLATIYTAPSGLDTNTFDFLGKWHDFGQQIDWSAADQSRLWQYNLHYFDYALDPSRRASWVAAVMENWVSHNPPRPSVGWEPYPVSLRIVNWIKFDLHSDMPLALSAPLRNSLYQQVWWLARNLEIEIQANHLLKNAKAVLFGGAYFSGRVADKWLEKGKRLFLAEVRKQFLADGGHFERSAMYHVICLEDILDVISLARGSAGLLTSQEISQLGDCARKALAYLDDISRPGDVLPMFNDSVAGIAPELSAIRAYARDVLPVSYSGELAPTTIVDKPQAGFFGYRHGREMLLIDAGAPGPPYQPGHSHCGLLSFELTVGGRPLIVDSGVHDYEAGALRHALRSTAAHNTVQIDGHEQSDIWGAFRMGRRARVADRAAVPDLPRHFNFTACHDGYRHLCGAPVHWRTFTCQIGRRWRIQDRIEGSGTHRIESFLHFHPAVVLDGKDAKWTATDTETGCAYIVTAVGGVCDLISTVYCPRFGERLDNSTLRISADVPVPASLGFVIEVV
jgi:uncharacterized heparinase superfamily protein